MANILRTASVWLKAALLAFVLGLILFIIGFATVSWRVTPFHPNVLTSQNGLWKYYFCYPHRLCQSGDIHGENDFHRAIQAMECLGLIGYLLAILAILLYFFADSFRRRDFLQATIVFTFAGVLFASIGFALFGSDSRENGLGYGRDVGWSMGIAIAGTILYGLGGIFIIVQLIK